MPASSGDGAGSAPRNAGTLVVRLSGTAGFGFDGGHDEDRGIDPGGTVIAVPDHSHEVSLDFYRTELALEVTPIDGFDVWLRIPYEVKVQRATVKIPAGATAAEADAMRSNGRIHHRDETYHGLGDLQLLVAGRSADVLAEGDRLLIAAGLTLPTGKTERDPFQLAAVGRKHQHIQFGRGTVDPLLEIAYALPLPTDLTLSPFLNVHASLYENGFGYRGPVEGTAALRLGWRPTDWLSVGGELSVFVQGYAHWDGHRDPNTGLVATGALLDVAVDPSDGFRIRVGVRVPISTRTLDRDGDAFNAGIAILFSISLTL
jgi:hypothetical protein